MALYHWLRIRAQGRSWAGAYERLVDSDLGAEVWGAFSGIFGVGSNELLLVLHGERGPRNDTLRAAGFEIVGSHTFVPTVRPVRFQPVRRAGLYVFRFFEVAHIDIDEIARLSEEAWTTFEHAGSYAAEPKALFAEADRSGVDGRMLLVTWYDDLESWQASRSPAPEASENFRRRRDLTRGTVAFATRLVEA
ncbi:MAG: hypothetical protein AAF480_12565 [Actinomycetota bacterium]